MATFTTSEVAKLLGRGARTVRRYTEEFPDYLSEGARPAVDADGEAIERTFTEDDVALLAWIAARFKDKATTPEIVAQLATGRPQTPDIDAIKAQAPQDGESGAIVTSAQSAQWLDTMTGAMAGTRDAVEAIRDELRMASDVEDLKRQLDTVTTRLDAIDKRLTDLEDNIRNRRIFIRL